MRGIMISVIAGLSLLCTAQSEVLSNPMFELGVLTFRAASHENVHEVANPVRIAAQVPASSIVALPPPMMGEPRNLPKMVNFSIALHQNQQFDICFFLNLIVPSYREAPDFRVYQAGNLVVQNSDFKRIRDKHEAQRRRIEEGDFLTMQEINELPSDVYPLKELPERCVRSTLHQGTHRIDADVQVDTPFPLWHSPASPPLMDITVVTDANREIVTESVEGMSKAVEARISLIKNFPAPPPAPLRVPPHGPMPMRPLPAFRPFAAPLSSAAESDNESQNGASQRQAASPVSQWMMKRSQNARGQNTPNNGIWMPQQAYGQN